MTTEKMPAALSICGQEAVAQHGKILPLPKSRCVGQSFFIGPPKTRALKGRKQHKLRGETAALGTEA